MLWQMRPFDQKTDTLACNINRALWKQGRYGMFRGQTKPRREIVECHHDLSELHSLFFSGGFNA